MPAPISTMTAPLRAWRGAGAALLAVGAVALSLGLPAAAQAQTAGNAQHGSELFSTHCAECHSMKEGKDKKGPSLFGVAGKPAAQRPGFAYSDAMKASGITWTPDKLSDYLAAPKQVVPGGKMKYDGLPSAADRADLIAYLSKG